MQEVGKRPSPARRIGRSLGLVVALTATVASIAACGSSGSSSSSSSSAPAASSTSTASSSSSSSSGSLKTGLKVFVIPKNLGNNYFTVADSVKTGGALAALKTLGETGTETSGNAATSASQLPAIQSAIAKGANVLIVSATDPTALCPTLKSRDGPGITVVTYDSDAPTCRNAVHQPGVDRGDRDQRSRPAREADHKRVRSRSCRPRLPPPTRTRGSAT